MTKVLLALVSTYAIGGGKMTTYDYDVLYIGSGHGTFDGLNGRLVANLGG